ncbi:MAG: hypothetical protein RDU24_13675 [Humidesulfovibrio sp.]|uniref:hypothetical protein n=1 Tax=Humidesulfovibrio sp. TaxID=2910988 RepID=UPI0027F874E9|nr:hypothetical protein [Humidesulfovibrio sp.]MDQ7836426.1 hypothetical protein [Humidesulfovibrio sp.]
MTTHAPHRDRALPDPPVAEASVREAEDPERLAYLDGLKVQIRQGVYQADIRDLARSLASMLVRDL